MSRALLIILALLSAALSAAVVAIDGPEAVASAYRQLDRQLDRASKALALSSQASAAAALSQARDVAAADALHAALGERVALGEAPDQTALDAASGSLAARAAAGASERSTLLALVTERGFAESRLGETSRFGDGPRVVASGDALAGKATFAYAAIDDRVYRVAVVPVGPGEKPLGALALGFPLDDAHAARLKESAGADVTVLRAGKVIASTLPPAERAQVASAAASGGLLPFGFGALNPGDARLFGVLPVPFLVGEARGQRGSAEPLPGVEGAVLVLSLDASPAIGPALASRKRGALVPVAILLLGVVLAALAGDRSRKPLRELADVVEGLAAGGPHPREDLPGDLGRIARVIHRILPPPAEEAFALPGPAALEEAPPPAGTAQLGAGPVLDAPTDPFGRPSPGNRLPLERTMIAPLEEGPPLTATRPAPFEGTPGPWPSALAGLPEPVKQPDPPAFIEAPRQPFDPFSAITTPGPRTDPFAGFGGGRAAASGGASHEEPTMFQAPEQQTVVAMVPDALLRATSRVSEVDPEAAHFNEVFREFLEVRKRCGEGVEGISFDKFAAKLRKNREQLVEKYKCRSVRFTVYVKDGKTALKATPVKD